MEPDPVEEYEAQLRIWRRRQDVMMTVLMTVTVVVVGGGALLGRWLLLMWLLG